MGKPTWPTVIADAVELPRFLFIAKFVAFYTKSVKGRALASGMFVKETRGAWSYGFHGMPPLLSTGDPSKLYDAIRRTAEEVRRIAHS